VQADLSVYISFDGRARQALAFYQAALGGELELETFGAWNIPTDPGHEDDIVYGVLRTDNGFVIRATDRPLQDGPVRQGTAFAVCLNGEEQDLLTDCWKGLAADATVVEPLSATEWGDLNGSLRDPYGVIWIFNIGASR
jgi:PhnB protein